MLNIRRLLVCLVLFALGAAFLLCENRPALAYVEAPHSLGQVIALSTNIMVVRVEQVDKTKNLIVFRKERDLKGKHPTDIIRHNIGRGGFNPREWQYTMDWAEPGKTAVFFHNGSAGEMCIGMYWYQIYPGGDWWNFSHGEPYLLRSYAGSVDKLAAAVTDIVAGREVVVPCMVDGNKDDLHLRRARIQRVRASLKLDYNPKRDFVGWGGEDFRRLRGMPGFSHYSAVARVDPDALAISSADINGDGKVDLCLTGAGRVALLQNGGEALGEVSIPGAGGAARGNMGRLQRRRQTRPSPRYTERSQIVHQSRWEFPRRQPPVAGRTRVQSDLRRLDRLRRRWPARFAPGQRLPRPESVSQQGTGPARRLAPGPGQMVVHRSLSEPKRARLQHGLSAGERDQSQRQISRQERPGSHLARGPVHRWAGQ